MLIINLIHSPCFRVESPKVITSSSCTLSYILNPQPAALTYCARSFLAYTLLEACVMVSGWTNIPTLVEMLPLEPVPRRCMLRP